MNAATLAATVRFASVASRLDTRVTPHTESWQDFTARFATPARSSQTYAEYARADKQVREQVKDVGGFIGGEFEGRRRKKSQLKGRQLLCLDMDHPPADWRAVLKGAGALQGLAWFYYSTHSHSPGKPRIRVVVPLDRMCDGEEYEALSRKVVEQIGIDWFDDTTHQPARLMYWPSAAKDGEYLFEAFDGAPLSVDDTLALYADWRDIFEWPISTREAARGKKLVEKRGKALQADPLAKKGIVGAFCRAYGIREAIAAFIPDAYTEGTMADRYSFTGGSTINGAVVYEDKWLYSHHESDPCSAREVNAFDLVRLHLFGGEDAEAKAGTPTNRLPSYQAMTEFAAALPAVRKEGVRALAADFDGVQTRDADAGEAAAGDDWMLLLTTDKQGNIKADAVNASVLITHDEALRGAVALNDLKQAVVRLRDVPWAAFNGESGGAAWSDADDLQVLRYLKNKYQVVFPKAAVTDGVILAAQDARFDPVHDYLDGLAWDNTPRLDTMLYDFLGVAQDAFTVAAGRKWMVAAVARAYEPGCKWDYAWVLEGEQGIGKSSFLHILAGDWFSDSVHKFDGREGVEGIQGAWICELAELQGFNKAEVESVKSFLSRRQDKVRLAYGRHTSDLPRRCVFAGTTNSQQYLRDASGNRRFWPLRCTKALDFAALRGVRDQLWAEAVAAWRGGESLYLEGEAARLAAQAQSERQEDDPLADIIRQWLEQPIPGDYWQRDGGRLFDEPDAQAPAVRRDRTCAAEIWECCLGGKGKDMSRVKALQIAEAMRRIGWKRQTVRCGEKYGVVKGYVRV